jgi:Outer membrane protein beta-barrel domain
MKILPLLAFTFLFFTINNLSSQSYFGIKGGYTNAWPDYGSAELPENAQTNVSGFNLSLMYHHSISKHFRIGTEPGYIQRGASCIPGWQPIFVGDSKVKLNYVELPIMASYHTNLGKSKFDFYGKLGYGVSYALSGKQELIDLSGINPPIVSKIDFVQLGGRLKRMDHGAYSGLGLSYTLSEKSHLILESNFYYGFQNYDKINVVKNRSVNVSVGYVMSL